MTYHDGERCSPLCNNLVSSRFLLSDFRDLFGMEKKGEYTPLVRKLFESIQSAVDTQKLLSKGKREILTLAMPMEDDSEDMMQKKRGLRAQKDE